MDDKITHYRKDRRGELFLQVAAVMIIMLLSIAGQVAHWSYYIWAVLVSFSWGEAMHRREPSRYPNPSSRRMLFLMLGGMIIFVVSLFTLIIRNPEVLIQFLAPDAPTPGPSPTIDPQIIIEPLNLLLYLLKLL